MPPARNTTSDASTPETGAAGDVPQDQTNQDQAGPAADAPAEKKTRKKATTSKTTASKSTTAKKTTAKDSAAKGASAKGAAGTAKKTTRGKKSEASTDGEESMKDRVSKRAYELYQERGGEHGRHEEDWHRAEQEVRGGQKK